jgi:hypothetical protein
VIAPDWPAGQVPFVVDTHCFSTLDAGHDVQVLLVVLQLDHDTEPVGDGQDAERLCVIAPYWPDAHDSVCVCVLGDGTTHSGVESTHVAPASGVVAKVPLVHRYCALPVVGDPASVHTRLDPLATVPPRAAEHETLLTVQLRTVPTGTVQLAGGGGPVGTQVLPVWIGPDHDTTLVLDGHVAVLV